MSNEKGFRFYVITDGDDRTRIIEGKTDQDIHDEIELYMENWYSDDVSKLSIWELGKEVRISTQFTVVDDL